MLPAVNVVTTFAFVTVNSFVDVLNVKSLSSANSLLTPANVTRPAVKLLSIMLAAVKVVVILAFVVVSVLLAVSNDKLADASKSSPELDLN